MTQNDIYNYLRSNPNKFFDSQEILKGLKKNKISIERNKITVALNKLQKYKYIERKLNNKRTRKKPCIYLYKVLK